MIRAQRHWRERAISTKAHLDLCLMQWNKWKVDTEAEGVSERKQRQLLADHLRSRRQAHVLKTVAYEKYDLKPLLTEAATSKGDRGDRKKVREFLDMVQRRGDMLAVAAEYDLSLANMPPPTTSRLLPETDLRTLQELGVGQMEAELVALLRGAV